MQQVSNGQYMCQGQYPLPLGLNFSGVLMMDSDESKMAQCQWSIKKNFSDCHAEYSNAAGQAHTLSFMHAMTPNLTLGFALTHIVSILRHTLISNFYRHKTDRISGHM